MNIYPTFVNAPITEALLDIRVDLPATVDTSVLESYYDYVKIRFPEKKQQILFQASFQMSPNGQPASAPPTSQPSGFLFHSSIENKIVQARMNGFTFNKLKPYEKWSTFRDEARELWDEYAKISTPLRITRIGLRYVNRIEIPLPINDFSEYILTFPEIAPDLPQEISHFFMQLAIPNRDLPATALINETMEQTPDNSKIALIFDIDVWQDTILVDNKEKIWDEFEKLRNFKNDVFFKSLTNKAKELFK